VLTASAAAPGSAVNLSTEGTTDWAHWGLTNASSFNHKSGVTAQISTFSPVGGGTAQRFDDNPTSYTWTGGTPTSSATNSPTGLYIVGLNKGFQLTVPADTTPRTLKLYVGGWGAQAKFEVSLSDQSAASYTDTSFNDSGSGDGTNRVYTLTYQAASPNQTLTLTWTVTGMNDAQWGNVSLQGATLVTGSVSGALAGSLATPSATVTLSTEGTTDWAHWGVTTASSFNHKSGITAQISNYTALGGATAARYDTNPNGYSWTAGTPTASATNSPTGLYINGLNKGFQITVPADTTSRTVKVYVGVWGAQGKLEATLSDSSASAYVDTSVTDPGGSSDGIARVYTLTYRAASAGQTLTVKWTVETMNEAQWGNVTLQAASLVTNSNSGTVYQDLQYAYTTDGNLTTIADHTVAGGAGDQAMTYDSLDRLTEAEGPYGTGGATASITYSYNELGNLTVNSQVGSYTYPTSGSSSVRPHAVTTAGSNTYSYDANGNMTAGAGRSFTYNLENKPLTITVGGQTTTFVYDGDNGRVKKIVGSTTTRYISQLYECENTNCSRMIFAGSERVATLVPSGGIHYYHPDHLGSSSVITDGTGATVQNLTYFPYGATRTNSSPVTPAVDVPYKYTGQELDASTDLYNYEARQYEAALGRFVSPDTVVTDPFNPQDLNRYAYVRNSPFNYTDPTGNLTCENQYTSDCIRQWLYDLFGVDRSGTPPTQPPQSPPANSPPVVPVREVTVTDSRLPPPITIFPSSPPPNTPYWGEFGQRGMGGDGRPGAPAPEQTREVINGLMQDIVGSALMSGQMAAAGKVSLKAITKLINASKLLKSDKSKVMEHAGLMGKEEKDRVFNSLTVNAEVTKTETKRGDVYKAGIEGGGVLASRDFSSGLPPAGNRPTLEIRIPGQPPIKIRF
jgi:RHS repeat-associated protein